VSDIDLPVEGRDVAVMVMVNGQIKRLVDQITNFTSNAVYDRMETKPLGTADVLIDDVAVGWEGTIETAVSRATVDDFMDEVHAAQRARVPMAVQIREQVRYRDGTVRTYLYPECKLQVATTNVRAEARKTTLNWKTGKNRIRV